MIQTAKGLQSSRDLFVDEVAIKSKLATAEGPRVVEHGDVFHLSHPFLFFHFSFFCGLLSRSFRLEQKKIRNMI